MAAKLSPTDTNVVTLKPRRAKGSKSTGGRKPASVSKPKPGQARPAARKKTDQPTDAEIRRGVQDRLIALHTKHRAAESKMLLAQEVLSAARADKAAVRASIQNTCVPLAIYDELHKKVTQKTKRQDNELYEAQRAMAFEAFGLPVGPRAELDFDKTPDAAKPAVYWEEVGFQTMLDGDKHADPQRDGVPPENLQDYMAGCHRATAQIGAGMKRLETDAAKPAAPPLMVGEDPAKAAAKQALKDGAVADAVEEVIAEGLNAQIGDGAALAATTHPEGGGEPLAEDADVAASTIETAEVELPSPQPDWTDFDDDPDKWPPLQQNVFLTWFAELGDEEVNIVHPGVAIMFDRCVAAEGAERVEPAAGAEEHHDDAELHAGPAPAGIVYMLSSDDPYKSGRQATYRDGLPVDAEIPGPDYPIYDAHPDGFEMSEAERQAQAPRRAIQQRREADPQFSDD